MSEIVPGVEIICGEGHHFGSHVRGGEPLSVRICTLCGAIDWADLREQHEAAATARAERAEAENTELRAKVGRVWVLLATWGEREPYHTVEYQFAIADLLAALDGPPDSTDPVEAAPGMGAVRGEGGCLTCGMSGADCLDRMNAAPHQPRCCHACGLVDTHGPAGLAALAGGWLDAQRPEERSDETDYAASIQRAEQQIRALFSMLPMQIVETPQETFLDRLIRFDIVVPDDWSREHFGTANLGLPERSDEGPEKRGITE